MQRYDRDVWRDMFHEALLRLPHRRLIVRYRTLVEARLKELCAEDGNRTLLLDAVQGGERLRPILLLLVAGGFGEPSSCAVDLACALEMVHKASLLHDDLIDQAAERRGSVAFHRRHSPALAIVVGDLLLSTATQIVGRTLNSYRPERKDQIQNEFHNMVVNLARGEFLALALSRDFEVRGCPGSNRAVAGVSGAGSTLEQLLNANSLKSASLIEGACRLGALVANRANAESYARVGYVLGCIFQLLDDLADMDEDLRALRLTPPLAWMLSQLAGDYQDLHVTFLAGTLPMTESGRLSQLLDWAGDQLDRWLADGWDAVRDISPGASRDVLTAVLRGIEASLARWRAGAAHTE